MNAPDVRRLLDDLGSVEPPSPDDEFLDRLEFQLRAEAIALAPDTYDDAPWRLPFGIAAAAFSVVVGVAGVTVVRDLPHREVSAKLAAVSGVEVTPPGGGEPYLAEQGQALPEGSIVKVEPGGLLIVDGVEYKDGQTLEVRDGRLQVPDDSQLADGTDRGAPPTTVRRGATDAQFDIDVTVPSPTRRDGVVVAGDSEVTGTTVGETPAAPGTGADPGHDASRVTKSSPREALGVGDDQPGPSTGPTEPATSVEDSATPSPSPSVEPAPTTTVPKTSTSGETSTSTSTTTPSSTTPSTDPAPQPPVTVPGSGTAPDVATSVPSTTVPTPPGGTTTTTVPVGPDGGGGTPVDPTEPPVGPDGGGGTPVDPGGGVTPAGGSEGEAFDDGTDVTADSGNQSGTFGDGTGDQTASDDADAGDDETAAAADDSVPDPSGSGDGETSS